MNKENIQKALDVMRRVDENQRKFSLCVFAMREPPVDNYTEEAATECGTTACFSGWLNLSPEWRSQEGIDRYSGSATYEDIKEQVGSMDAPGLSMARYLGIPISIAEGLIYNANNFYGDKTMSKVTLCDVIGKLEMLLKHAEDEEKGTFMSKVRRVLNRG